MILVWKIKLWAWGSQFTPNSIKCGKCGFVGAFIQKQGMRIFTLYWIIPLVPVSGIIKLRECPNCHTKFIDKSATPGAAGAPPGMEPSPFSPLD